MNEPTVKEVARWLREDKQKIILYLRSIYNNKRKPKASIEYLQLIEDRAAQVEAMGERICLTCEEWLGGIHPIFGCSYDGLIHCKKLNIPGQGCNFGCIHWKRKDG